MNIAKKSTAIIFEVVTFKDITNVIIEDLKKSLCKERHTQNTSPLGPTAKKTTDQSVINDSSQKVSPLCSY